MKIVTLCLVLALSGCSLKGQQSVHVGLQAGDLLSTYAAESRGAIEANPVMQTNWPVRIAIKGAVTTFTIWLTDRIGREHQTVAKIVLASLNGVLAGVIVNNLRQGR